MFLLALLALLTTSFFGWLVLGVSAIMLIWLVARIHQEFSGGSGTKKLWPTIWFIGVPTLYLTVAAFKPNLPLDGGATGSFVNNMWANLTFGHACAYVASYLGIGLLYSLFEMRVTLWRNKKTVITRFESYMSTDIKTAVVAYVEDKMGNSLVGNSATVTLPQTSSFLKAEQKAVTWLHMIPGKIYTWADAFVEAVKGRTLLTGIEDKFKQDVATFKTGVAQFLAEAKHENFNPNTAYTDFQIKPDGTLDASINKGELAICLTNWTIWWWGYLLNFVFGDMFEAIYTRLAAWVIKIYGGYVKKYFADITAVKL